MLLIALVSAVSVFANPPYPTEEAKGYVIEGLATDVNFTLVPGTPGTCTERIGPVYSTWECPLTGNEVRIEWTTAKKTASFDRVHISERAGTAARPGSVSYSFEGKFLNTFPNGKTLEVPIYLELVRESTEPNRLLGNMYFGGSMDIPAIAWLP